MTKRTRAQREHTASMSNAKKKISENIATSEDTHDVTDPPNSPPRKRQTRSHMSDLQKECKSLSAQIDALSARVDADAGTIALQQEEIKRLTELVAELRGFLSLARKCEREAMDSKNEWYNELRNLRKVHSRTENELGCLQSQCLVQEERISDLENENSSLHAELKRYQGLLDESNTLYGSTAAELRISHSEERSLRAKLRRSLTSRDIAKEKARLAQAQRVWSLLAKGVYTPTARALSRQFVSFGMAEKHVGKALQLAGAAAGLKVIGRMGARTVGQTILEGGLAAKIQSGYEISRAPAIAISGDATSHKNVNYEATHVTMSVPNYADQSKPDYIATRAFNIDSTVSHHAEVQLESWKRHITEIEHLLKNSPFARRVGLIFNAATFARVLKAYHSDHAADQKKLYRLLKEWKAQVIRIELGEDHLLSLDPADALKLLDDVKKACISAAGGEDAWNALSDEDRQQHIKVGRDALALKLGDECYAQLSDEERRIIDLFFWAGCSMHKELNSVVGGYALMETFYMEFCLPAPVLLANKDNDATIKLSEETGQDTEASDRAKRASKRGAVKLAQLAGAYFRNKDDKKGAQDQHRDYFQCTLDEVSQFPNVGASRYHSICLAAARLLKYLPEYRSFMQMTHDKKDKPGFNHMEANIDKALKDPPTLSECAVVALYYQMISGPYASLMRGDGSDKLNMLKQGPLHRNLIAHIRRQIMNPSNIFGTDSLEPAEDLYLASVFAASPGGTWLDETLVNTILTMYRKGELPYLVELFTLFLVGALETWARFTSEFDDDSIISKATAAELDSVHVPTSNCPNEGLLGSMRTSLREKGITIGHFNDHQLFKRNDTQAFMDAMFTNEDHEWLLRKAREVDRSGVEKKRRRILVDYGTRKAAERQAKLAARLAEKAARAAELAKIKLLYDEEEIQKLKYKKDLLDQLDIWRSMVKGVKYKSHMKNNEARKEELLRVVREYLAAGEDIEEDAEEPDDNEDSEDEMIDE